MTRLGWTGSLFMAMGLALGVAIGWGVARQVAGLPGQLLRVGQVPTYEPVEIVPDSVDWPEGDPVTVQTVDPPSKKVARKIEKEFDLDLSRTILLGKFDLPDMPNGGRAVPWVPRGDKPEPVRLRIVANPPPLVRVRWEPTLEGWAGYSTEGNSWSSYLKLGRLLCIRDRLCFQARGGYEVRSWASGAVAEVGVSVRF